MSPEQLIEKMACSVMDEWGETPQGYAIQKSHAKYMLLVVLSHIKDMVTIEINEVSGDASAHHILEHKIILKEPYRKMLEEGIL